MSKKICLTKTFVRENRKNRNIGQAEGFFFKLLGKLTLKNEQKKTSNNQLRRFACRKTRSFIVNFLNFGNLRLPAARKSKFYQKTLKYQF